MAVMQANPYAGSRGMQVKLKKFPLLDLEVWLTSFMDIQQQAMTFGRDQ